MPSDYKRKRSCSSASWTDEQLTSAVQTLRNVNIGVNDARWLKTGCTEKFRVTINTWRQTLKENSWPYENKSEKWLLSLQLDITHTFNRRREKASSSKIYSITINSLKDKVIDFHANKPKNRRSFHVELKGLHPSTELYLKGHSNKYMEH